MWRAPSQGHSEREELSVTAGAIDQACCDMVFTKPEGDQKDLVERITSRHGLHQLAAMRDQKMGNPQYELIEVE